MRTKPAAKLRIRKVKAVDSFDQLTRDCVTEQTDIPCAAGPSPLHDPAGTRCSSPERGAMPGNAQGSSLELHFQTCHEVLTWQLGANMACRSYHVQLYVCARSTSSWPGNHARPATGLCATRQGRPWHLTLEKTLEAVRVAHAPEMRKFKARRPPGLL